LYSSILQGESEYQFYNLENNFDQFKNLTNNFINSIGTIRQKIYDNKDYDIKLDINEFKKDIDNFNFYKNKFAPFLNILDGNKFNTPKLKKTIDILCEINSETNIREYADVVIRKQHEIQEEFSNEKLSLLFSSLSEFITLCGHLDFFVKMKKDIDNDIANGIENGLSESNIELMSKLDNTLFSIKNIFADKNSFLNEFIEGDFEDAKNFTRMIELKKSLDESYEIFHSKIKNNMGLSSYAEFLIESDKANLSDFIKAQSLDKTKIELTGSKYSTILLFEDNSIILKKRDGGESSISNINQYYYSLIDVVKEEFKEDLKKHPIISKRFLEEINLNFYNLNNARLAINTFLESKFTLKSAGFNIIDYFNNYNLKEDPLKRKLFENLDDKMNSVIQYHKVKQFAESIVSNKYIHLYNEESYKIFSEILDLEITTNQLQNLVGKKIAFYQTPEEFNGGLRTTLSKINGFYAESYLDKAEICNSKIISNENNILILQIDNFNQSAELGSNSWCISRNKHYFDSYTQDSGKQFFVYDFNLNNTDKNSMIGITLNKDEEINACYSKFDESIDILTENLDCYHKLIVNKLAENSKNIKLVKQINL
jgi:hypothetical protein